MKSVINLWDYLKLKPTPIVEIKDNFRKNICKKIIERYNNYKNFSKLLNIPYTSLVNYLFKRSRNTIRFYQLYKICKKLDISNAEIEKNILFLRPKKYKNFSLPFKIKSSEHLASLIGHVFGDGHIEKTYFFSYTNKSKILHKEILDNINYVFNYEISPSVTYHKAYSYSYPFIVGAVLTLCGASLGDKKKVNFDIPEWIKSGDFRIKKNFLRALFDDEASIKLKSREIVFKMGKITEMEESLDNFLESIREMLVFFNIQPSSIRFDNKHESKIGIKTIQKAFGIYGQENFKKFKKFINFSHPQKRNILSLMIKKCKIKKHRAYEAHNIILNIMKKPLTIKGISNKIGLSPLATYKNLRKLEKRGLVIQIKFPKNIPSLWEKSST
jgi:hypothetical protein